MGSVSVPCNGLIWFVDINLHCLCQQTPLNELAKGCVRVRMTRFATNKNKTALHRCIKQSHLFFQKVWFGMSWSYLSEKLTVMWFLFWPFFYVGAHSKAPFFNFGDHCRYLFTWSISITPNMSVTFKASAKPIVHHSYCAVVQASLASDSLPLSVYCLSSLVCPLKCACPVKHPVLVSLVCGQEKAEECQPASIQLLLSYWYSRHI